MTKKKAKIETPEEARAKAKEVLAKHHDRQARLTKAASEPARKVEPKAPSQTVAKRRKMSGLDAAAYALAHNFDGMSEGIGAKALTDTIIAADLWSPAGKTPAATLAAAIIREIAKKGPASRFEKVSPGKFALRGREVAGA